MEEWSAGDDPEAIAERHGVTVRTLIWWRSELVRRERAATGDNVAPRLLPVEVARPHAASAPPSPPAGLDVTVVVGPARLTLRGSVRASHLEAIVRGLVARC
jgi:hypothetical protein